MDRRIEVNNACEMFATTSGQLESALSLLTTPPSVRGTLADTV